VRYRLNEDWLVGGALEFASAYDFERPYNEIGVSASTVVDAAADSTMISVWAERRYNEQNRGGYWFWTLGAGINNVDVDNVSGTTPTGGTFDIKTDADTEFVIFATFGRLHNISDTLAVDYGVRLAEHFGDWTIADTVSGVKKTAFSSYPVHGAFLSLNYRF